MYANQEHAEIIRRMTEEFDEVRQISRNVSVLSEVTCKIWADFAKDWQKIGILQ